MFQPTLVSLPDSPTCAFDWLADSERLLLALESGHIHGVDLQGESSSSFPVGGPASALRRSPDDRRVAIALSGSGLRVHALDGHREWETQREVAPNGMTWSPIRDWLALASGPSFRVVNGRSGEQQFAAQSIHPLRTTAFSTLGDRLATGDEAGGIILWDAKSLARIGQHKTGRGAVGLISWAPDDHCLAVANAQEVSIFNLRYGNHVDFHLAGRMQLPGVAALDWSSDGQWLATVSPGQLDLWDVAGGRSVFQFPLEAAEHSSVRFSPSGEHLACLHQGRVAIWRVADIAGKERPPGAQSQRYVFLQAATVGRRKPWVTTWGNHPSATNPIPQSNGDAVPGLHPRLAWAWLQLSLLGIPAPLALIDDVLNLLARGEPRSKVAALATEKAVQDLIALKWKPEACVGLTALLLHRSSQPAWSAPSHSAFDAWSIYESLENALQANAVEPLEVEVPTASLSATARLIDERALTVLQILGEEAVARDPGLPLRTFHQAQRILPLRPDFRILLGQRIRLGSTNQASAAGLGIERGGIDNRGDLQRLLPSQRMLPARLLAWRHHQRELLYHSHVGDTPPTLQPAVIVLDVSAPCLGEIEQVTRLAAFVTAKTLLERGIPVHVVFTDAPSRWVAVRSAADLVLIWTRLSLRPAKEGASLDQAMICRLSTDFSPHDPLVLLMTHSHFGAEAALPQVHRLRGLFVHYQGRPVHPPLASRCEKWVTVHADRPGELEAKLPILFG